MTKVSIKTRLDNDSVTKVRKMSDDIIPAGDGKYTIKARSQTWPKTMSIRLLLRDNKQVLQQMQYCLETGEEDWKDVELHVDVQQIKPLPTSISATNLRRYEQVKALNAMRLAYCNYICKSKQTKKRVRESCMQAFINTIEALETALYNINAQLGFEIFNETPNA